MEYPDGTRYWFMDGKLHREDGPAVEYPDGSKKYYRNGTLHRIDGPAIEDPEYGCNGWCLDGEYYTEQEFYKEIRKNFKKNNIKNIKNIKTKLNFI